ncbi:MAG: hypothetical protein HY769_05405 [Candidatus Stahlbacteria bacterium]|nr:hypothetical protein [Candidatus Stahlbacteria bacterium]
MKEFKLKIIEPMYYEKEVKVSSDKVSLFFTDEKFADTSISEIKVEIEGKELILPLRVHKIEGAVEDLGGCPLGVYLWGYTGKEYDFMAKCGKDGKFIFYYPAEKKLRLFICDRNYAKKHLEYWFTTEGLKDDIEINPVIGNFELWEHKVWIIPDTIYPIWNVFFVPAIVDKEIPPQLEKEDVKIFTNGKELEIKEFTSHQICFKGEKEENYHPAYILSGVMKEQAKKLPPKIMVKIVVHSEKKKIYGEAECLIYI